MENSPFGKLPAEIRNDLYRMVLEADKPLAICSKSPDLYTGAQPPITRVCSQIREETLPMFYHSNLFSAEIISGIHWNESPDDDVLYRTDEIKEWFQCLTPKYLATIQNMCLVIVSPDDCELSRNKKDWKYLIKTLKRLGLVGGVGKGKMRVDVWLLSDRTCSAKYQQRRAHETWQFFRVLGLEVEVTIYEE